MDRAKERMTLKHSINSKFLQTVKRYHIDKNKQGKENIKENYKIRDQLMKKVKGENSESENENFNIENEENEESENNNNEINDNNNNLIIDFGDKKKKNDNNNKENENIDSGVFNMPFMKKAEKNQSLQEEINNIKNKMENEDDYFEESEDSNSNSSSSENEKKEKKEEKKEKKEKEEKEEFKIQKLKNITSSDLNKITTEAKNILNSYENKNESDNIKINLTPNELQKIINEDDIIADTEQFNKFIIENEENKKEFLENENKEKIEQIKKENPQFMSGWGSWAGDSKEIKTKEFLKKKRYENKIKRLYEISNNESEKNPFVKINKSFDKNFSNYLVKELPKNIQNREQFEKLNSNAIGREWNTLTMYKKMIQPKIISKIGQIIQPMDLNDNTKAQKIVDIIEKVTKKKHRTKTKL